MTTTKHCLGLPHARTTLQLTPPLPLGHLLFSKRLGTHRLPAEACAHLAPDSSLRGQFKNKLVNIFPRERVVIPTPPSPSRNHENNQMCTDFSTALGNLHQGPVSPLRAGNKQGPEARGKSRIEGGTAASGSGMRKFWATGPVNFPRNDRFPPAGS